MTPEARIAAAADILDRWLAGEPAEKALTNWARASRFAGSKDRAAVRDHVFDGLRCRNSFVAAGGGESGRQMMIGALRLAGRDPREVFTGEGHAPAPLSADEAVAPAVPREAMRDLPDWIWPRVEASLGMQADAVAEALRHRAPVHLRVNIGRNTREAAQKALAAEGIATQPHPLADTALEVTEGARKIASSAAFRDGLVELQDAASQAVCASVPLRKGLSLLDYCAGGGGKSLALAARERVMMLAHDADPRRMANLPERAERAGAKITLADRGRVRAAAPYDVVLCDVPCSGSGAWRRSPEGKWRLTAEMFADLLRVQAEILDEVAPLVRPGGLLVYATCSVLSEENSAQVQGFAERHSDFTATWSRIFTPLDGGDGFFVAHLQRDGEDSAARAGALTIP